jgi:hypothetical protein
MPLHKTLVLAASVLLGVAAPLAAQTLGDVARKSEEARKTAKKDTKVYTNSDAGNVAAATAITTLGSGDKPADTTTPADTTKPAETAKPGQAPTTETAKDQAYWSERMKTLRMQLERDIAFRTALQVQINSLTTDFVNRDDPAQRAVIETDRNRALAELDRLSKAIEDDKKAIAEFEEEARRANVPAGWLR